MGSIMEFRLGEADRATLRLKIKGRERPDALDVDDRNWLQGGVEICSGHMAGAVPCSLRAEDIADFRRGLARLTAATNDRAALVTMEDRLAVHVARDDAALVVHGHIRDVPDGNRLSFRFRTPAAGLPAMLRELDEILDAYLVR